MAYTGYIIWCVAFIRDAANEAHIFVNLVLLTHLFFQLSISKIPRLKIFKKKVLRINELYSQMGFIFK
jgi:hypothetical protein